MPRFWFKFDYMRFCYFVLSLSHTDNQFLAHLTRTVILFLSFKDRQALTFPSDRWYGVLYKSVFVSC